MTPIVHPLARHGTTQSERLLKSLIPENLQLDDRSLADVLAFAGSFARQVRFWDSNNAPDGDWHCFFEKDATVLLAIVAATDLDELRLSYRSDELKFVHACQKEKQEENKTYCDKVIPKLYPLVLHIFEVAKKLLEICQKLPSNHPLKAETQALIREKLGIKTNAKGQKDFDTPIGKLISYHKGITAKDNNDKVLYRLYEPFLATSPCQEAWGLTPHDYNCIDFKDSIDAQDRETLWRLFLAFYKVLALVVTKAEKAFNLALHGRRDHPPHIALFLAFVLLFRRYHQADMNGLVGKHLLYYYQDVLRLQQRREIPDRVHVVFEIAQNIETYRLQKDTLLLGGKDTLGLDRLYTLTDELVINKAKLIEKQSLYFYEHNGITTPIALPAADLKDGIKTRYPAKEKVWHPLSGVALYKKWAGKNRLLNVSKRAFSRSETFFQEKNNGQLKAIIAKPGLVISSPELWLDKSDLRVILIQFNDEFEAKQLNENFDLYISSETEKIVLDKAVGWDNELEMNLGMIQEISMRLLVDNAHAVIYHKNTLGILLNSSIAPLGPIVPDIKNPLTDFKNPFIFFQTKIDKDYEVVERLKLTGCKISTASKDLKNISLQVGSTPYAPTSEIPLVGSTIEQTTTLYITAAELSLKNMNKEGKWPLINIPLPSASVILSDTLAAAIPTAIFRKDGNLEEVSKSNISSLPLGGAPNTTYSPSTPYKFYKQNIVIQKGPENAPINIYKIPPESISISYQSEAVVPSLYWVDFLGGYSKINSEKPFALVPPNTLPTFEKPIEITPKKEKDTTTKTADGNLRLGFEALLPGQTLSLLFHFAEGTGNPDKIAPDEIVWSYLRQNEWVQIPPQFILIDETLGLRQTGIVRFQIPADINNQNTLAIGQDGRRDLYWLQASATENPEENIFVDALPELIDIFPQAATAVFQNNQNEVAHLENGLPAQTIAQLRYRDPNVSKVEQPFVSFDGRLPEGTDRPAYYRRIHERLRHRQRAITLWDYERITLEAFPKVAIAKCLTHTRDTDVMDPGSVTLVVVPYPERMQGNHKYYPIFNAGFLETIERHLNRHNSYFVSGQGGGVVCCCAHDEDDCGCDHDGHLLIRNAIFEPVRLQVCVKFRKRKDEFYYKKQLNEDLKNFLAPWATNSQTPLLFGTKIYTVELLRFLENLDYIDVVMGLKVKHFANREMAENFEYLVDFEEKDIIAPFTSRSVLTTYLDVLNEDNDNVIDHDIQVPKDQSCCADCTP